MLVLNSVLSRPIFGVVPTTWLVCCTTWLAPGNPFVQLSLDRFIAQLALDPSHTVHLQGPPRAIYTFAPLGLQFLAREKWC